MRYIPIENARAGMILAMDLFDSKGRTVIGNDCKLTDHYIQKLKEFGFAGVYIEDNVSRGVDIDTAISPKLRKEGIECVKKADIEQCSKVAKSIVDEILPKERVSLDMADLRSFDDYTFAHSVNVAVYSCVLGIGFGLNATDLENLTLAALLHDIGKLLISENVVNKPGRLTQEEYQVMKTHPSRSYEILADRYEISSVVRQAVLLHHENEDGSGYPNGLSGDDIPLIVKIIHVADVYDALTSNRPYKEPYSPSDAAEYLMGACGIMFDKKVVEKFLQLVPLYPKGMEISLSNKTSGVVIENSGAHNLRPVVRLVDSLQELDLAERDNYSITILSKDSSETSKQETDEETRKKMIATYHKKKIMVVDDMATNLQMIKEILETKYDLILMKSGAQAIRYIEKIGTPDLVLMDIDMPEMNGVMAAHKIIEMTNIMVPILFVSAICDRKTVLMCKDLHAAGYIVRPYKAVYIKSEIERILENVEAV